MNDTEIEGELLNNPKSVYYGALIITLMKFKTIPCQVVITSPSIAKVKIGL
jgi:hypothetical protein